MKTRMMFAFLKEDCPLFSRALVAPWRLCFLAAGLVLLCVGSHVTPSDDWDYPISFIMGVSAYVFAPWTVRALVYRRWKWLVVAFLFMWVSIDGVYSLYWWTRGFDALQIFRGANAIYCLPLYFALGFVMNVEVRRGETAASTAGLVRSYFAWIQKHALHVVITGFLMFVFAWGVVGAAMLCLAGCDGSALMKYYARRDVEAHFVTMEESGNVAMTTVGDEYMAAALEHKMARLSFEPPATVGDAFDFLEDCALNCLCKNGHDGKGRIRIVACVGKELLERSVPYMKAEQIPVKEALQCLCESVGCRFKVDSMKRTVTIVKKQVGDNKLEAKEK